MKDLHRDPGFAARRDQRFTEYRDRPEEKERFRRVVIAKHQEPEFAAARDARISKIGADPIQIEKAARSRREGSIKWQMSALMMAETGDVSLRAMAMRCGVSKVTVYRFLMSKGFIAWPKRVLPIDDLAAMIEVGNSAHDIAEACGCHPNSVFRIARDNGFEFRSSPPAVRVRMKAPDRVAMAAR